LETQSELHDAGSFGFRDGTGVGFVEVDAWQIQVRMVRGVEGLPSELSLGALG
jgi:hypothetical protein